MLAEAIRVTLRVTSALTSLGVPHWVGGSLASSLHGEPRATNDVDLVALLAGKDVAPFVALVAPEFYVDAESVRDAVARHDSFNLIHSETVFKVDIFVPDADEATRAELSRVSIIDVGGGATLPVASPEDTVVQKLRWFRLGGEVSDRQWRDIVGVLRIKASRIDHAVLQSAAAQRGVSDLLARALADATRGA